MTRLAHMLLLGITLVLAAWTRGLPAPSCTYFVAANGNDSNNGTSSGTPWQTFTHVNALTLTAGQAVCLRGIDTFSGQMLLGSGGATISASTQSPALITSYGGGAATFTFTSTSPIQLIDASNVRFQNLNFLGIGAVSVSAIVVHNDSTSAFQSGLSFNLITATNTNTVFDIEATGAGNLFGFNNGSITNVNFSNHVTGTFASIYFGGNTTTSYAFSNWTFQNIAISGTYGDGLDINSVNNFLVSNYKSHDSGGGLNGFNSGGAGGTGIEVQWSNNGIIQNIETYNIIGCSGCSDADGIDIDQGSTNIIVQYFYSHDNSGGGITIFEGTGIPFSNVTVRYGITQNNGKGPTNDVACELVLGADGQIAQTGVNVYNNTFYNNLVPSGSKPTAIICFNANNITGYIANNIVIGGANTQSLIDTQTHNPTTTTFIKNDYFGLGQIKWNSTTYASVALWQAGTGQDASALTSNPSLVSAGNGGTCTAGYAPQPCPSQYQLNGGSPMLSVGLNLTSGPYNLSVGTQDYYGNAIPTGVGTGYNIGAY